MTKPPYLARAIRYISLGVLLMVSATQAQFPPKPENVTVLQSRFGNGITISYKEPGICETTPGVKSYSGYVTLPPHTLADLGEEQAYPINTFFWFFESRKDPANAPLSIWLNGGPGASSMTALLSENGPCFVNADSNSTRLNPWSWNNEVNMLYIDQPVQTGFSYDTLANYTFDLSISEPSPLDDSMPIPQQNATLLVGTLPSYVANNTANTTQSAAIAMWHFAQAWFQEFPHYHPSDSRISLSAESYGGKFGPRMMALFEEQNQKIKNGTWKDIPGESYILKLDTLLIVQGCIDRQVQWPSYPHIFYNNTYGIRMVNTSTYDSMVDAYYKPGGCRDQINDCRALTSISDPYDIGNNATVNEVCHAADVYCIDNLVLPYRPSGKDYDDFAIIDPDPQPDAFYIGYLNQPHVQAALGVPLNYSDSADIVNFGFQATGDISRPGWLEDLAYLLDNDIKVTMMYGDRDLACNWIGGEAVSLVINHTSAKHFKDAGYADIRVNDSYFGGKVRQYGKLSFSRVFEAGHEVPAYQPETAFRIFQRAIFDRDIATGEVNIATGTSYGTRGPGDTWQTKNRKPAQPLQYCYTLDMGIFCTDEQIESVLNGSAVVKDWIVVDANSTQLYPDIVG